MQIRKWKSEDLPRIHGLLIELAKTINHEHRLDLLDLQHQFADMNRSPDVYRSFVCETDGEVAGFISLVFYSSVLHTKGTVLVNELIVAGSHRGRGIGRALLEHAIGIAQSEGWDEIEVGVEPFNTKAIGFYKACGMDEESLLLEKEFD
jgi:ribosomal protein S18 acetylase RimI-like enzyme